MLVACPLVGASVGDSEAWWVGPEAVVDLTRGQARTPRLGRGQADPRGFTHRVTLASVEGGGRLILGSDGFFKYSSRDAILRLLRDSTLGDELAEALGELPCLPSGDLQDDASVVVFTPSVSTPGTAGSPSM